MNACKHTYILEIEGLGRDCLDRHRFKSPCITDSDKLIIDFHIG